VPSTIEPVSEVDEKNIFEIMAQSLNANFMTDLALELSTTRFNGGTDDMCTDSALAGKRFVIVGASHGMRLASALEDMGASIVDISVPGWRVSADGVEALKTELSTILSEEFSGETYIIYQLFDNSMYWQCDAEGNRSLPVKGPDSQYHIQGRLVYIERANFKELFMLVLPLLIAGLNHTKVLLSPLMRYVTSSCCNNVGHMINRGEKTFAAAMGLALGEVKEWLQDFTFTRRIRNFTVLCSNTVLCCRGTATWRTTRQTSKGTGPDQFTSTAKDMDSWLNSCWAVYWRVSCRGQPQRSRGRSPLFMTGQSFGKAG
jgi:hypothetical protein